MNVGDYRCPLSVHLIQPRDRMKREGRELEGRKREKLFQQIGTESESSDRRGEREITRVIVGVNVGR